MIALGVDPGTAVTGYGLVRASDRGVLALVECGVVRTRAHDPLPARLAEIFEGLSEVLEKHRPAVMAVEGVFYGRNVRSTVTLAHARGVALLAGQRAGIPVHEYAPAEIKKAVCGAGGAAKAQVQFMVARLLRLASPPTPADAADAVAAALTWHLTGRLAALAAHR